MPLESSIAPYWMEEEPMPSPAPEFARKAIQISMTNDHAALQSLKLALLTVAPVCKFAEHRGPLFVSASFCVDDIAATPYVPIPLTTDRTADSLRIAPDRSAQLDRYQRSLLNVSRSMQLADKPIQGVLSWAHITREYWYEGLPIPGHVKSVATAEAKAIGAREMMFVPLHLPGKDESDQARPAIAPVVIMLWWKKPLLEHVDMEAIVSSIRMSEEVVRWAAGELRRLREGDATRYQLLVYLRHIEQFLKGKGPRAIRAWNEISHNTGPYLGDDELRPVGLDWWLQRVLNLRMNPMSAVEGATGDIPVRFRGIDAVNVPVTLKTLRSSIARHYTTVQVKDGDFAQKLIDEALHSITGHESRLLGVDIDLTNEFCHLAFKISRGRKLELQEYFAIRRGFFVPTTDGLGIGLALFSRRASMRGAFRALYVSPDGAEWRVDVAIPVSHERVRR